jgi:hypothetical protein
MTTTTQIDKEYIQEVSHNIFEQLGGNKFRLITGSKDFMYLKNEKGVGLTFTVPRARPNLIDRVKIYLSPLDTYNMEFYTGEDVFAAPCNVYVDNMLDIFETVTGHYATLNPRR